MSFIKKKVSLKFKIKKDMIFFGVLYGVVIAVSLLLSPVFGAGNAMAIGNCFLLVCFSMSNDYTTKLKDNTLFFSAVHVGLGVLAWVASYNIVLKGIVFFFVVLFLVYKFNRGKRKPMYLQLMMSFIFFVYFPVYGMDLVFRLILLEVTIIVMMIFQVIFNKQRFRATIEAQMDEIIRKIDVYASNARGGIGKGESELRHENIENLITSLGTLFFNKFAQINQWERGTHYLRLLSVLKSMNNLIYRYSKTGKKINEKTYLQIKAIIDAIDEFNFEKADFDKLMKEFSAFQLNSVDSPEEYFVASELEVFVDQKEETDNILVESQKQNHFNKTRFKYSLKTAIMCAGGVFILGLFNLPYEYWYPINIAIMAQPFYEFNRDKGINRILNTVVATGMLFFAFNITGYWWLQLIVLIAFVFLGDMVFKINYHTLFAAFMALIVGYVNGRGTIIELSELRLLYSAATSAIILLMDSVLSPKNLKDTFIEELDRSEDVNNAIMGLFVSDDFSGEKLKALMDHKTDVNKQILNLRAYYTNQKLDAYSLNEQTIIRMYNVIYESLVLNPVESEKISQIFQECVETEDFDKVSTLMPGKSVYSIYVMYDMYDAMQNSNKMIEEMKSGLQGKTKNKAAFENAIF